MKRLGRSVVPQTPRTFGGRDRSADAMPDAPDLLQDEIPTFPPQLRKDALAEWNRLVPLLRRVGLLTIVDRDALVAYCMNVARYFEAEKHLEAEGAIIDDKEGDPRINPWLKVSEMALSNMKSLLPDFGLTPIVRAKLRMAQRVEVDPEDEEMFG